MPSLITATVLGHCARDPEIKNINGTPLCEVSVPVNKGPRDNQTTTWVRVSVWGKPAGWLYDSAQKGSLIHADGELLVREFTRSDGTPGYSVELRANKVLVLTGRRDQPQQQAPQPRGRYGGPGQPVLDPPQERRTYSAAAAASPF